MTEVGPDGASMALALRYLQRSHDDPKVTDALGRRQATVTDAITGAPVPHFVYRLDCGHLEAVFLQPLPAGTTYLYCPQCDPPRERLIAELLLAANG